jgi:polar amino acid transport system substrate-binding protein
VFNKKSTTNRRAMLAGLGLAVAAVFGTTVAHAQTDSVADIKKKGTITIGIQGDNSPWGFVNTSGTQDGFDADIGRLFAADLGVKAEFMPLAVANRIPALTTGRVDVLFATMAMTAERAKAVQYSKPYVANIIYLIAAKADKVKTNDDMKKLTIAVPQGSIQDLQITKFAPEGTVIRRLADDAAAIQALISGQTSAVGGNMFYLDRIEPQKPGLFENTLEFTRLYNGACAKLGDKELNAALNTFIDKIRANGELAKAYAKWMKQPVPDFSKAAVEGVTFEVK